MAKIEIELDEKILKQAQKLAEQRHCALPDLIAATIAQLSVSDVKDDRILGMWADESALVDEITEEIMSSRLEHHLNQDIG